MKSSCNLSVWNTSRSRVPSRIKVRSFASKKGQMTFRPAARCHPPRPPPNTQHPPPCTHHPHRQHGFREKRSRSIPGMDQCLWLGCCIRPFGEVTPIQSQLAMDEEETSLASGQSDSMGREVMMSHQAPKKNKPPPTNRWCHTYVWTWEIKWPSNDGSELDWTSTLPPAGAAARNTTHSLKAVFFKTDN